MITRWRAFLENAEGFRPGEARRSAPYLLLVGAIALTVYANVLQNGFVTWDDNYLILGNPTIRSLAPEALARMFDPTIDRAWYGAQYLPLSDLSYAIDWRLFGPSGAAFHVQGLLWHLLAVLFTFATLHTWRKDVGLALIGALVLAVHPAGSEAVAWASGRRTAMCLALAMASAFAFLRAREHSRLRLHVVSVVLFALACLAKQSAVLLPLGLLALDRTRAGAGRHPLRSSILAALPIALVGFGFVALHAWVGSRTAIVSAQQGGLTANVKSALLAYAYGARVLFWPTALRPVYAMLFTPEQFRWIGVAGASVLCASGAVVLLARRRLPALSAALVAAFFLLAPSFAGAGSQVFAERYLYPALPFFGAALGAVFVALRGAGGEAGSGAAAQVLRRRGLLLLGLLVLLGGLATQTVARNRAWRNDLALWSDAVEKEPASHIAHALCGLALTEQSDRIARDEALAPAAREASRRDHLLAAEQHLVTALRMGEARRTRDGSSALLDPVLYLANVYERLGDFERTEAYLQRFFTEDRQSERAHQMLGAFYERRGRRAEAVGIYRHLLRLRPGSSIARERLQALGATPEAP